MTLALGPVRMKSGDRSIMTRLLALAGSRHVGIRWLVRYGVSAADWG